MSRRIRVASLCSLFAAAACILLTARGTTNDSRQGEYEQTANDGIGDEDYRPFAPIHEAAKRGDVQTIKGELAKGVPVDLRVATGGTGAWRNSTPLMWAAARGQAAVVRVLLDSGADVNAKNDEGVTPLMAAAGSIKTIDGDPFACVRVLIEAGVDLEVTNRQGLTALYYACGAGAIFDIPPDELLPPEYRLPSPYTFLRPGVAGLIAGGHTVPMRVVTARQGDAERVKALLEAGADIDLKDEWGSTFLMAAVGSADAERLRLLLEAGADVNAQTEHGWNALLRAAGYGNGEMVELLLEHGADHTVVDNRWGGQTVLIWAARGQEDSGRKVKALLASGVDVTKTDDSGRTALLASLERPGGGDAATVLLEAGADPKVRVTNGNSAFVLAAKNGPTEVLGVLLEHDFDVEERANDSPRPTPLVLAAESELDAAEKVQLLLEAGADIEAVSDDGTTALLAASRAGNMKAVVLLAQSGANVNVVDGGPIKDERGYVRRDGLTGMTPLMYVANRGAHSVWICEQTGGGAAAVLIKKGADVDARDSLNRSALLLASAIGHTEVVEALLAATPKLDSKSVERMGPGLRVEKTALSVAIEHGDVDVVRSLVAAGADVNGKVTSGMTPLMLAAIKGEVTVLAILIDADADIHAQDDLGQTALVYIMHGTLGRAIGTAGDTKAAVRLLIEKGANIEVVDHDGQTPLMHAATVPSDDAAKILVEAGADISKVNKQGETALEIARRIWRHSQQPVVEYLETVFEQRSRQ